MENRKLKRQRIVLDIVFDESKGIVEPSRWNWPEVLDTDGTETAGVEAWTTVEDCEETENGAIISKTPYFEQSNAVTLFGAVGTLQREIGSDRDYVLHGSSAWIRPAKSDAVVYVVNSDDGVIVEVLTPGFEADSPIESIQLPHGDLAAAREEKENAHG